MIPCFDGARAFLKSPRSGRFCPHASGARESARGGANEGSLPHFRIIIIPSRLCVPEAPAMPPVPAEPLLAYAEPGVRTAPPRTLLRVLCRAVWELIHAVTRVVQAVLLVLGYLVL